MKRSLTTLLRFCTLLFLAAIASCGPVQTMTQPTEPTVISAWDNAGETGSMEPLPWAESPSRMKSASEPTPNLVSDSGPTVSGKVRRPVARVGVAEKNVPRERTVTVSGHGSFLVPDVVGTHGQRATVVSVDGVPVSPLPQPTGIRRSVNCQIDPRTGLIQCRRPSR